MTTVLLYLGILAFLLYYSIQSIYGGHSSPWMLLSYSILFPSYIILRIFLSIGRLSKTQQESDDKDTYIAVQFAKYVLAFIIALYFLEIAFAGFVLVYLTHYR